MNLKVELEKAKKVAWTAKEAAKASEQKSYNLGVQEIEARLAEELAEVCKEYCKEVWTKALTLASVPEALKWRRAENMYYPPNICEAPTTLLSPIVDDASATTVSK